MTGAGGLAEGRSLRRRVYDLLDPTLETFWDLVVHRGLIVMLLVNTLAVILESVPAVEARHHALFLAVEIVSGAAFTAEYLLRLWTAPEHVPLHDQSPLAARLAYAVTPAAIVDLLAIVPFALLLVVPLDLRVLLLVRLLRFFKLARYSPGLASLAEAVWAERRALTATLFILGGLVITMAALMHLCERGAQPGKFGTIPDAMWWAVVTLTTVGYGDAVPVTPAGKVVAGVTAIMGLALIALPVGIIATAFADVIHRREFVVTWAMVARVPVFTGLSAGEVAEIMELLRSQAARKGQVIVRRGDQATAMYFVVAGSIEIEPREGDPFTVGAGEFFGELAILAETPRSATARASEDAQLLVLEAQDLERLMDRVPEVGRRIRETARARAAERGEEAEPPPAPRRSRAG